MLRILRLSLFSTVMAAICYSSSLFAAIDQSSVKVTWGYRGHVGPEFWGRLNPSFTLCSTGKLQSPIDIAKNDVTVENTLSLHYLPAPLAVIDDGETSLLIGNHQTIYNDGHTLQVNFHDDEVKERVSYKGNDYKLKQLHFHSPSENQLNDESAPMEIHFVHQGKHGAVLAIGVLVKGGAANAALQTIIDHLPAQDGKEYILNQVKINPHDLFPLDNDYYSFPGSLTTPPCTEGLEWVVMAGTITASPAQIATIRKAIGGSNARSVQPLNNRIIAYSMGKNE